MYNLNLLIACIGLMTGSAYAESNLWVNSRDIVDSQFHKMTAEEHGNVIAKTESSIEASYALKENSQWYYHNGDLTIEGSLDNENALVVNGNLTIHGSYDDYYSGSGELIVLGNVVVDDFLNRGFTFVNGKLDSSGVVFTYYNDHYTEVTKGVQARGIIVSDKAVDFDVIKSDFILNDYVTQQDIEKAYSLLVPDIYFAGINDEDVFMLPDDDSIADRVRNNQPLFRTKPVTDIIEHLHWIDDRQFDNFATSDLSTFEPLVTRTLALVNDLPQTVMLQLIKHPDALTREYIAHNWPEEAMSLVTDDMLNNEAVARGLINNVHISTDIEKKLTVKPIESVQLAQAQQKNLSLQKIAALSQSPFINVQKTLVNSPDYIWLMPDTVINTFIHSDDEALRERITGADLSWEQALVLSQDTSIDVRKSLAETLAELKLTQASSRMSIADIENIAIRIYEQNKNHKDIVSALFIALPESLQISLVKENTQYLKDGIRYLSSPDVLNYLLEHHDIPAVWSELARDRLLPVEFKHKLWLRAKNLILRDNEKERSKGYWLQLALITDGAVDTLLLTDAVSELDTLPTDERLRMETELFAHRDMPQSVITQLDKRYRLNSDWALSLLYMRNTTRAQCEKVLRVWYEEEEALIAELDVLKGKTDDEWWEALAHSVHEELREVALINVHTPVSTLIKMKTSQDRAWAINSPLLPETIKTEWLQEEPALALALNIPNRLLLRTLLKTGVTAEIRNNAREKLADF